MENERFEWFFSGKHLVTYVYAVLSNGIKDPVEAMRVYRDNTVISSQNEVK
jgi:hypothetical protein